MEWLKELFGVSYTDVNQFLVRMGTNLLVCVIILSWFLVGKGSFEGN